MDSRTRDALCDPALLAAREEHFARLQALFSGEPLDCAFVLCGARGVGQADPYAEPERWVAEALADLASKADRLRDPAVFRPLVLEFGPYDVHFVDRLFGAEVFELHAPGNWQSRCLKAPVGELAPPDLDCSDTWALAQRLAQAFLAASVTVPLFGLPTIASALNVGLNLYGGNLLLALSQNPPGAARDLQTINLLLCELHRWYLERVPLAQLQPVVADSRTQPPGFGQLCGCSTQLLSPELYRDFVAPLDEALLRTYPHGGMIHLCGRHTQHLPAWREMPVLRAVQLNDRAAEDLETYFRELREDQVLYVNPCPAMPIERILEITGGRRLVLVADVPEPVRAGRRPARAK